MAETLFADISYYQSVLNDKYPYRFVAFRANDGTFRDPHFAANLAWAKSAVARGRLDGFLVYFVWETAWQDTVNTFKSMVGAPHPKMAVMIDVESWGGKIRGNQSAGLNASRENLISWLGGNRLRVMAYGNSSDLAALWPSRGDTRINLANWGSSRPAYPNKIAQQISATFACAPFGHCDMNATPYTPAQFAQLLGIGTPAAPPKPTPVPAGKSVWTEGVYGVGSALTSPNKKFTAVFQSDGNFVLYDWRQGYGIARWASKTAATETPGLKSTRLYVQADGNVVVYAPNGHGGLTPTWNAGTFGRGTTKIQMQDDGSLAIYQTKGGTALWAAHAA